ncbi:dynamin family protein [Parabacteroides distasonis]|nr:dynamin family protein [Parabacteroides distasonis]
MKDIDRLIEIANAINAKDIESDLLYIKERSLQPNAELIFPLVGEFSSGKTTLINALTDSKKLETATKPTTATIYEVHFGCDRCYATVLMADGSRKQIDHIEDLKNDVLSDAVVVNVFDTSKQVPNTTILVDTPGLSSPDPKHRQTLVDFLPQADGILLVTDVNQQITRSLTDFIETMKLSKRPIFLVITKSDTKSPQALKDAKQYISENCKLPIEQIACVSANNNDLSELHQLLDTIQKVKNEILKQVDAQRIEIAVHTLLQRIDELLKASNSDKELDQAIRQQESELNRLIRNIDQLVDSTRSDIEGKSRSIQRKFDEMAFDKLETLVSNKSDNFDADAVSTINSLVTLLMNQFRTDIQTVFQEKVRERRSSDEAVNLHSLEEIDLSQLSISGLPYDINLNELGHQYDSWIATSTKVIGAAAAAAAIVSTGGAAAGLGGAALTIDTVADVADTATDVASIMSNRKTVSRIEKAVSFTEKAASKYNTIENYNQQIGQQTGASKGMVESLVGLATDKLMGKPQRKRAIHKYLDETLCPCFEQGIEQANQQIVSMIKTALNQEAADSIQQKKTALNQLKQERKDKSDAFAKRISQLRDYKNVLVTL